MTCGLGVFWGWRFRLGLLVLRGWLNLGWFGCIACGFWFSGGWYNISDLWVRVLRCLDVGGLG